MYGALMGRLRVNAAAVDIRRGKHQYDTNLTEPEEITCDCEQYRSRADHEQYRMWFLSVLRDYISQTQEGKNSFDMFKTYIYTRV